MLQHVGVVAEQDIGVEQQVVKVHGPRHETAVAVDAVNLADERALRAGIHLDQLPVFGIYVWLDEGILGIRDNRLHGRRFVHLVVELHLLDDALDEREGVGGIVYGEVVAIAQPVGIGPQDARENRVERACPKPRSRLDTHHLGDTAFHLVGRLVGKGQRQQPVGGIPHLQEVSNLVGKHPSLSRPGTGNHQFGSLGIEYGIALLLVQVVQKIFFHVFFLWLHHAKIAKVENRKTSSLDFYAETYPVFCKDSER